MKLRASGDLESQTSVWARREEGHPTEKTRLGLEKRFGSGLTKTSQFSRQTPDNCPRNLVIANILGPSSGARPAADALNICWTYHREFNAEENMLRTIAPFFIRDERGQDLIEYALVTGLLSVLSFVLSNVVRGL
jgi:hypothetical protein